MTTLTQNQLHAVFSQLNTQAFVSNLALWTRHLFESAVYLGLRKEYYLFFMAAMYFALKILKFIIQQINI